MTRKDQYYNRAKQEGYRSRSAYKLRQLDEAEELFAPGKTVVDLGAAPGGWLQVAAEEVGPQGSVVGVDLQRVREIETDDASAPVETIRGDMTEDRTREKLRATLLGRRADEDARPAELVISDMAPNMTGEYSLDQARSVHLARQAFETALDLLGPGGDFAVKVFEGRDVDDLRAEFDEAFRYVRTVVPDASRDSSSELYLIAKERITAPVETGDELGVEIVDVGGEGDGIAKVEGFTLFVPGADEGESPTVRVTDVKPQFGFAERV